MKKKILSLLCSALLILSLPGVACAADVTPKASYYFGATDVRAYAESGGNILIEIDVEATHTMLEVGASHVYIYEQQSDGDYDVVYTYTKEAYPHLTWSNCGSACIDVNYQGTIGKNYFATVTCYARDSNGSESRYYDTNVVTAVLIET